MKNLLVFALSAIALSAVAAPLRFLSFNIWGDYFKNPVEERQAGVESVILGHKPDLVSLQEVTPNWWASPLFANMKAAGFLYRPGARYGVWGLVHRPRGRSRGAEDAGSRLVRLCPAFTRPLRISSLIGSERRRG